MRFNGLSGTIHKKLANYEKQKEFKNYFEEFLFKAHNMHLMLTQMNKISELIEEQATQLKNASIEAQKTDPTCPELIFPQNALLEFNTALSNEFLRNVSPFLNTLFVLQDRILVIIGKYLNISDNIPLNLPGFFIFQTKMVKPRPILTQYGNNIKNEVKQYWTDHAREIRKYRNLDQHEINLLQFYGIDKDGKFHLYLPDDPKTVKGYADITYTKRIDALALFNSAFTTFHDFVEKLIQHLNISPQKFKQGIGPMAQPVAVFETGECMSLFQDGESVVCVYCGEKETAESANLRFNQLPLENSQLTITLR